MSLFGKKRSEIERTRILARQQGLIPLGEEIIIDMLYDQGISTKEIIQRLKRFKDSNKNTNRRRREG